MLIDIGGEGRHAKAWNVNPSRVRTFGPQRGEPIPRLIRARADRLPFATGTIRRILVERTPLTAAAVAEIARVVAPGGLVLIRHVECPDFDRHALARRLLPGRIAVRFYRWRSRLMRETRFHLAPAT